MATAQTICDAAYRKCGILSPTEREDNNALIALNNLISLWGLDFIVPYVTRESKALTIGTAEYTIGSGGDFDTVRPLSVVNCYLKDSDDYSYDIKLLSAKDYNLISSKTLDGRPTGLYFIPEYALAKVIFNKEPDKAYTAYFEFWKNFTEFATLSTTCSFPNEYKIAMIYNLAVALSEDNTLEIPRSVYTTANSSLNLISRLNAVNQIPPKARFDMHGRRYNIVTDE